MLLIPTSLFKATQHAPKAWGRGEDPGSPEDEGCGQDAHSSAASLPCQVLAAPRGGVEAMDAVPVPAGWWGRRPGAPWSKRSGRKQLAGDQLPAHCSCRWKSWGCPAWTADPSTEERGSFVVVAGRGEQLWDSPGPASPSMGCLQLVQALSCVCAGVRRACVCIWCWTKLLDLESSALSTPPQWP